MRKGFLSQYFAGVAVKRLTPVEVDPAVSNQHEFNGSGALRRLLGDQRRTYQGRFLWLPGDTEKLSQEGRVTWYDAREAHPSRSEFRLYFSKNNIMDRAHANDLLMLAIRPNQDLYMIIIPAGSTLESQLCWLFGVTGIREHFDYHPIESGRDIRVDYALRYILEEIGIEVDEIDDALLDGHIEPYLGEGFPTTAEFSALARKTCPETCPREAPDDALLVWMEQEEKLFKRLEQSLITERLRSGFWHDAQADIEGFLKFSLSVHNRRKSRVGGALENHVEAILNSHGVLYSRAQVTENKSRPDFIFPNIENYRNPLYPAAKLTMLGVKSTCKDRWRQVLAEANRIRRKHLLTLEPSISESQTMEMAGNNVQLVLPQKLHYTYSARQQKSIWTVGTFLALVRELR